MIRPGLLPVPVLWAASFVAIPTGDDSDTGLARLSE
jgi:hypothetical protein